MSTPAPDPHPPAEDPAPIGPGPGWPRAALWLPEPARPAAVRRSRHALWLAVATVCLGAFLGQVDASIVTIALPAIHADLGVTLSSVEWVSLGYLLAVVALVAPLGAVSDSLGRKSLYLSGFALFGVASGACALSPDLLALVPARVVQGVGAALLQANSIALIRACLPPRRLGRALGIQGAAQALGLATGPALGGALLALGSWRLLFLVNLPVAVVGIAAGALFLPRSRGMLPRSRPDWAGMVLLLAAATGLLLALSWATGAERALTVSTPLLLAAVALSTLLVRHERRAAEPVIPLPLLRARGVARALAGSATAYAALFGVLFVVPFYLHERGAVSLAHAGLLLSVLPVALGAAAPLSGFAIDQWSSRSVAIAGSAAMVAGIAVLAGGRTAEVATALGLALTGAGIGLYNPAVNVSVMLSAPASRAGAAGGALNMARGLGTALGVALAALAFDLPATPDAGLLLSGVVLTALSLAAGLFALRPGPGAGAH